MTTRVHTRKFPAAPAPAAPGRRWLPLAVLCVTPAGGMGLGLLTAAGVALAGSP